MSPLELSKSAEYRDGMWAFVHSDFDRARELFLLCLAACGSNSEDARWTIMRALADVEHASGNRDTGAAYFAELIGLDPTSPLPRLMFAKSLLCYAKDRCAAVEQLTIAESLLSAPTYPADDQELPRVYYEDEFARFRAEIGKHKE
jgi:hypothetical protein